MNTTEDRIWFYKRGFDDGVEYARKYLLANPQPPAPKPAPPLAVASL